MASFHSQLTHQSDAVSNHSHPVLFFGRLAAPDFVMKCIEGGQGCSAERSLEVHTGLLHYCTFRLEAVNDAQNVRVDTAHGKDNDQQNLSKM